MGQAGRIAADRHGGLDLERRRVDDRHLVGVRVGGEDAACLLVEADVDRLVAGRDLADHLVRLEVDDRDEVAARARDERAPAGVVDGDSLGVETDGDLGDLPPRRARVDPARGSDGERRVVSLAGRRHRAASIACSAAEARRGTACPSLGSKRLGRRGSHLRRLVPLRRHAARGSARRAGSVPLRRAERHAAHLHELDGGRPDPRARAVRRPRSRGVRLRRADGLGARLDAK